MSELQTIPAEVTEIAVEVNILRMEADQFAVVDDLASEAKAIEFLGRIKTIAKKQEDARTFLVKPLNDHIKTINAEFKKTSVPLEEAEKVVKYGISLFRSAEDMRIADARRKELEKQASTAMHFGDTDKVMKIAPQHAAVAAIAPKTVETAAGKASFKTVYHFEVEDPSKLPEQFMIPAQPDLQKIQKWVNTGGGIDGVKVWTTKEAVIRIAR